MWIRRDLKEQGKRAFHRNYWALVAVCFLLAFVGAEYTDSAELIHRNDNAKTNYELVIHLGPQAPATVPQAPTAAPQVPAHGPTPDGWLADTLFSLEQSAGGLFNRVTAAHGWLFRVLSGGLFLLAGLVMLSFGFLVSNPLMVGARRFLLRNREAPVSALELLSVFHRGPYCRTVFIMFLRWLYLGLWTLLLVVPGIIKSYEYRMVPFLLASNPALDRRRIFALSRIMMRGSKWRSFVLDVSFFFWHLLSALSFGLAGIFYVNPYVAATEAELYAVLRRQVLDSGVTTPGELPL